jgi:predicted dehydrogenase
MQTTRAYWPAWAERLQHWKLTAFAAWLLEAGGPLTLLGSQALYFARPFFGGDQVEALARILEEDEDVLAFANYLREEASA